MYNFWIDVKIYYLMIQDETCKFIVDLMPNWLIYKIVYQTLQFVAPTVLVMSMFREMRKRGLIEYHCFLCMITKVSEDDGMWVSEQDSINKLSVRDVLTQFRRI